MSCINGKTLCRFNLYKSNGKVNGIHLTQPYNSIDTDYFIFEIGGTLQETNKYQNNFCIIPSDILTKKGYLTNDNKLGKKSISICLPDCKTNHWSLQYWNNFSF
jgi:hypothetical protein